MDEYEHLRESADADAEVNPFPPGSSQAHAWDVLNYQRLLLKANANRREQRVTRLPDGTLVDEAAIARFLR